MKQEPVWFGRWQGRSGEFVQLAARQYAPCKKCQSRERPDETGSECGNFCGKINNAKTSSLLISSLPWSEFALQALEILLVVHRHFRNHHVPDKALKKTLGRFNTAQIERHQPDS